MILHCGFLDTKSIHNSSSSNENIAILTYIVRGVSAAGAVASREHCR